MFLNSFPEQMPRNPIPAISLATVHRATSTPSRRSCRQIFLYDTLAGGAGFSTELVTRASELFKRARKLLATSPNHDCDASCYRCLQSFRNRMEHGLLDRKLGIQLLEHALGGGYPAIHQKGPNALSTCWQATLPVSLVSIFLRPKRPTQ